MVSRSDIRNMAQVNTSATEFIEEFRQIFEQMPLENVFNTDQSGFNIELLSGRTLENKGTKIIEGRVGQQHSVSHSYTIQPLISASGELIAPLFIIMQETNGQFGPLVRQRMFRHKEIFPVASSSGKVTKGIMKQWFLEVYFPNVPDDTCLLGDALNTYRDRREIDNEKPETSEYTMKILPKGTTGIAQPLDVYFFRLYKSFTRRITDNMNFNHQDVNMHLRDNILKLQTLVHNQFRSPRFKNCLKYAWKKCGYFNDDILAHITPREFCFPFQSLGAVPDCNECDEFAFIRCAWCKLYFCMGHFFILNDYHYCENYLE